MDGADAWTYGCMVMGDFSAAVAATAAAAAAARPVVCLFVCVLFGDGMAAAWGAEAGDG